VRVCGCVCMCVCVCVCVCVYVCACACTCTYGHVGGEAGDQRGGDGVGDGGVGVLGLLARGGDDVEADEGVEAGGRALHHLGRGGEVTMCGIRGEGAWFITGGWRQGERSGKIPVIDAAVGDECN